MNYKKIYRSIISKAQKCVRNKANGYYEKHHILPKCLGGSSTPDNLISLTAKEHFICHILLAKIYGGKLWHAAHIMSNVRRYTSRKYEYIRLSHALEMSKKLKGTPNIMIGIKRPIETRNKIQKALLGRKRSEQHNKNWLDSRKRNGTFVCPESKKLEQSKRMKGKGNIMFGRTHTEEARKRISKGNRRKVECPHCKRIGAISIMKRWHFDRCRNRSDST